jgi:hypothetical protein
MPTTPTPHARLTRVMVRQTGDERARKLFSHITIDVQELAFGTVQLLRAAQDAIDTSKWLLSDARGRIQRAKRRPQAAPACETVD